MDPLSAMLLAVWIAGYFTRNTVQDLAWKARGEDPPSVRREQARRERRAERAADPGPGRRFWGNVWSDAVASAEERRERVAAKSAEKRRAKWAEDEAYAINDRLAPDVDPATNAPAPVDPPGQDDRDDKDEPVEQSDPIVHDEVVWRCEECGTQMRNAGQDSYERGTRLCRACQSPNPSVDDVRRCYFCNYPFATRELWPTRAEDGTTVGACPACWHDQQTHKSGTQDPAPADNDTSTDTRTGARHCPNCGRGVGVDDTFITFDDGTTFHHPCVAVLADADPTVTDPAPHNGDAEIIQFADWQRPAATGSEENDMSAEITGLQSAIAFAEGSAASADQAAAQVEIAISSLEGGGTSGASIVALRNAMEAHQATATHYRSAAAELISHLQVTEAYVANQGAGSREFVKAE